MRKRPMSAPRSRQWRPLALALLVALAACSLFRAHPLVGKWRAESFDLNGLKLPVGPEITFTRDSMLVGSEAFAIDRVDSEGSNVTVYLRNGVGLSFVVEDGNHMRFVVPVIGTSIRYDRP